MAKRMLPEKHITLVLGEECGRSKSSSKAMVTCNHAFSKKLTRLYDVKYLKSSLNSDLIVYYRIIHY